MSKKEQVVSIRMPAALLKKLDVVARKNERTRSSEMRRRLEESLRRAPQDTANAA